MSYYGIEMSWESVEPEELCPPIWSDCRSLIAWFNVYCWEGFILSDWTII